MMVRKAQLAADLVTATSGGRRSDMPTAYLQSMAGGGGGLQYGGPLPGLGMHAGESTSRPWGQKINSNDKLNEWKLFIGQVPLEVRPIL